MTYQKTYEKGMDQKRDVSAAYSEARKKGYKIPKRQRAS
jgi:hypothetical protein